MTQFQSHKFAVAPLMDWTDRHCRVFHRLLSRRALLYTEMVTTGAVLRGDRDRLLAFSAREHPVALQIGGSEPEDVAAAGKIGAEMGYDEINLNVGCPSDRVQSGRFGACLMREPERVAECMAALAEAVAVPVSVKCRIGVDEQDPQESLFSLVDQCAAAGVTRFIVHARKAWLKGLSPKENRDVPPLDYEIVHRLKAAMPHLTIAINGGIGSLDAALEHLQRGLDGVMMGRAAYHEPGLLAQVDRRVFEEDVPDTDFWAAVEGYIAYVEDELARGTALAPMTHPLLGLFHGRSGARAWRRILTVDGVRKGAGAEVIRTALSHIRPAEAA